MEKSLTFGEKSFFYIWAMYYIYEMANSIVFAAGSAITIVFNLLVIVYVGYYGLVRNGIPRQFSYMYVYILFLLLLVLFTSTDVSYSMRNYLKYLEGIMCFPLAFFLLRNSVAVDKMWWLFKVFVFLFIFNYVLANMFHLGGAYGDIEGAEIGNLFENGLYLNVCAAVLMPLYLKNEKYRNLTIGSITLVLIITIVVLKRTPIAGMITSLLVYIFFHYYFKYKYGLVSYKRQTIFPRLFRLCIFSVFLLGLVVAFWGIFTAQIASRSSRFVAGAMQKEGRVKELSAIYNNIVVEGDDKTFFLGKETFNIVGTYGIKSFGQRNIHDDFGIILNGTGVIGFLFYVYVNAIIIIRFFRYSRDVDLENNETARKLYVIFISFWCIFLIASMSDTILLALYPAMHYTISGMILRYFYEYGETYNIVDYDET